MTELRRQYEIIAVPTPILTEHDEICAVIEKYALPLLGAADVICVAESVLAITQGRAKRCDEFQPGLAARILCRLFPSKGSISSPYSMQALLDVSGLARVSVAVIAGAIAKIFGISGVFYRLAGDEARLIDDVTGTMPPYDKHIVYGPAEPAKAAQEIAQSFNCCGAAVADVNDLKRSEVLGVSRGVDAAQVAAILIDNPFGNGSEKTPICIIKNYHPA